MVFHSPRFESLYSRFHSLTHLYLKKKKKGFQFTQDKAHTWILQASIFRTRGGVWAWVRWQSWGGVNRSKEIGQRIEKQGPGDRWWEETKIEKKVPKRKRGGGGETEKVSASCCTTWLIKCPLETFIKATAPSETLNYSASACGACSKVPGEVSDSHRGDSLTCLSQEPFQSSHHFSSSS